MLTKDDRPLILLRLLDEDVRQQVLQHLPAEQAASLRKGLAGKAKDSVDWSLESTVIDEFQMMLEFLEAHAPATVPTPSAAPSGESTSTGPTGTTAPQLHIHDPDEGISEGPTFKPSHDPIADLERMPAQMLGAALQGEQPRIVAILLSRLSGARTAELLGFFKDEQKQAIVKELSRDSVANPALLDRLARATIGRAIEAAAAPQPEQTDRLARLTEILRSLDKAQRGPMLQTLEEEDPELAGQLSGSLYKFEDLGATEDRVIQKILGQVESTTLATALFKVDDAILQKVLKNLSRRAQQSLTEELQLQTHVPTARVQQARAAIAQIMAKIAREEDA